MATVSDEVHRRDTPLRQLLVPLQSTIDGWRQAVAAKLDGCRTIRPGHEGVWSMAGQGIDLRMRWWLTGFNGTLPGPVTAGRHMCTAETGARLDELAAAAGVFPPGALSRDHERSAGLLAVAAGTVEARFRNPAVPCPLEDLSSIDAFVDKYRLVVEDVVTMTRHLPEGLAPLLPATTIVCGPLAAAQGLSGDADLLVDGCLVEVKCTIRPRESLLEALRQLAAYACLVEPTPGRVALFLPRQRLLTRFALGSRAGRFAEVGDQIRSAYGGPPLGRNR